ncbi:hypothetical protein, partial [Edwardsiella piscicida]|uniref:hypothetical protein n=1 Tax=Edwardsiella piscicida TaxID=1263550 RepID=UPI001C0EB194
LNYRGIATTGRIIAKGCAAVKAEDVVYGSFADNHSSASALEQQARLSARGYAAVNAKDQLP